MKETDIAVVIQSDGYARFIPKNIFTMNLFRYFDDRRVSAEWDTNRVHEFNCGELPIVELKREFLNRFNDGLMIHR